MPGTMHSLEEVAEVRVLYVDTDQMGVVNNMNYLRWFEVGRAEWLRKRGHMYRQVEATGVFLPLVEAHLRYRSPARYDDLIRILAGPQTVSAATVTFAYALHRKDDDKLLAEGWTRHAAADRNGRVRRFPVDLLEMLGLSERGS